MFYFPIDAAAQFLQKPNPSFVYDFFFTRLLPDSSFYSWTYIFSLQYALTYLKFSKTFKNQPVGEVLLPRRSGILCSSLCRHRRFHSRRICRPTRNPTLTIPLLTFSQTPSICCTRCKSFLLLFPWTTKRTPSITAGADHSKPFSAKYRYLQHTWQCVTSNAERSETCQGMETVLKFHFCLLLPF